MEGISMDKRNSYLISRSMKTYLAAAIASMLIQNINTIVDGILMGRFLGTEAFSAVNLCLPLVGAVTSIGMLFYSGATILTSVALGAREDKKANSTFSVALISVLIVSVILMGLSLLGLNGVTGAVCTEEALKPFVKDYLFVYFLGCPVIMAVTALLAFTDVGGRPKLVTMSSLANVVINILGDVIYVGVLKLGIKGAALATISGSVGSLIMVLVDAKKNGKIFRFENVGKEFGAIFKANIKLGVPMASQTIATVVYAYICSISAQKFCGVNGAFVVSLLSQATSLCQGVSGGVSMSYSAIGGMLAGQRDMVGVNFLFKKGVKLSVIVSAIFAVILMVFAPTFAMIMGAEAPELIEYSTRAVRMAMLFVIPITVVWGMSSIFAIGGAAPIIPVISVSQPILTGIGLWVCALTMGSDFFWLGYPVSAVVILLLVVALTEGFRKKSPIKRHFFSLIPNEDPTQDVYDISVACDSDALVETLKESNPFFERKNIDSKIAMRVRLCVEEMMLCILEHAERGKNQFFDLKIIINDVDIFAVLKDDGKPFDPIHAEEMGPGLKIINGLCPQVEYKYSYGLNMTFFTWKKDGAMVG